jgi:peptidoglycan hydrolase CwlO-like protein
MPRLLKSLVLSSAFVLAAAGLPAHAGPVEDARYAADVAQAEWQRSRCALDDAVEQLRVATARRDALSGELDGTLRQIAQWPAELERIRADIRRMDQDLSVAKADEQRIAADLERMRADLNRAERALEAVRQAAVGECVGIGQYRDALAWRARCIERIELRRQVVRGPLMSWPSYRELFQQFNATRSGLEKLKTAGAGESQIKPVQERLDRIVSELRGYEDDALARDPQAMDARAELDRAERELDRLQASIDRQLDRNPSVLASKRRIDAINASIEQATGALQQVRQQRARIEQALHQAREAERCFSNGPWQLHSRACALREQLAEADQIVRREQARVAQLQVWECALRERRDQAETHYQYVLATYCPPAPSRPRLVVVGDPDTHDYRDGRPRPSDPSRRPTASREGARDDSRDRPQQASRATPRRTSPDGAESRRDADRASRVSRDNAASARDERSSRSSGGESPSSGSDRAPRRAVPQERG